LGEPKGIAHIGVPFRGRQIHLRRGVPNPNKGGAYRKVERPGQLGRLIEATGTLAPGMKRHGHREVDVLQEIVC
jgi:hypothetical protein